MHVNVTAITLICIALHHLWRTCITCVPAGMPVSVHVSIFVRPLRACVRLHVSTCAHIYVFVRIYIRVSHCDIRTTAWVQIITAGAKPLSHLSNQHKAGCPSRIPWPLWFDLCALCTAVCFINYFSRAALSLWSDLSFGQLIFKKNKTQNNFRMHCLTNSNAQSAKWCP